MNLVTILYKKNGMYTYGHNSLLRKLLQPGCFVQVRRHLLWCETVFLSERLLLWNLFLYLEIKLLTYNENAYIHGFPCNRYCDISLWLTIILTLFKTKLNHVQETFYNTIPY